MYNFIICEDNFNTGILLKKIITEYANEKNLDYNIKLFNENFDQVIEFTKSNIGHVNVFFMDIILNEENSTGLTLINRQKNRCFSLFHYYNIPS